MIFDVIDARRLFVILKAEFEIWIQDREHHTAEAISLILMTNHLREWIAPGYNPDRKGRWRPDPPVTPEQRFSREVYNDPNFKIVRAIANGTKHAKERQESTPHSSSVKYAPGTEGLLHLGSVGGEEIFTGIPIEHLVDNQPLETVLAPIIDLYRRWFEPPENSN
jgi:hypothetical protein